MYRLLAVYMYVVKNKRYHKLRSVTSDQEIRLEKEIRWQQVQQAVMSVIPEWSLLSHSYYIANVMNFDCLKSEQARDLTKLCLPVVDLQGFSQATGQNLYETTGIPSYWCDCSCCIQSIKLGGKKLQCKNNKKCPNSLPWFISGVCVVHFAVSERFLRVLGPPQTRLNVIDNQFCPMQAFHTLECYLSITKSGQRELGY